VFGQLVLKVLVELGGVVVLLAVLGSHLAECV
jgi:hypothetical protein